MEVVTTMLFFPSSAIVTFSVTFAPGLPVPVFNVFAPSVIVYVTSSVRSSPLMFFVGNLNETVPLRLPFAKFAAKSVAAVGAPSARASGTVIMVMMFWFVNSPTSSAAPVVRLMVYSLELPEVSIPAQ